jgi:predicted metal-dependent enzyme (double-stranded beta helix superfamily)
MSGPTRLREFIRQMALLTSRAGTDEPAILAKGRELLLDLIRYDDWLPEAFAKPDSRYYQQYLLYCDPLERFSVVSFVWGPGQSTPVHDHTVWGLVGVLRGAEVCESFERRSDGALSSRGICTLAAGEVDAVSPSIGDIHRVKNAFDDRVSVSIHAYGADIGAVRRHVFVPDTGEVKNFVSGYANTTLPNLWGEAASSRDLGI